MHSFLILLFPVIVIAQFVPAPTDLINITGFANISVRYKEVPTGICEQNPNIKSFSGYVDIAPNQHIFFWFFEARNVDPTTAPLTIWVGDVLASMAGLFVENVPCAINSNGQPYTNPY